MIAVGPVRGQTAASGGARVFAHSRQDAWLLLAAAAYGAVLTALVWLAPTGLAGLFPCALIAVGTVWISNTVSHCHLHTPLFSSRAANRAVSLWLTALLLIPQTLWKQRHLWHHMGEPAHVKVRLTSRMALEIGVVVAVATLLVARDPRFALTVIAPGYLIGLGLCRVQGHFEHLGDPDLRQSGVSHYGAAYNFFWFNDGYHSEHHREPGRHWTTLPLVRRDPPRTSAWSPLLRWIDGDRDAVRVDHGDGETVGALLGLLERAALRSGALQRFMLRTHTAAFREVLTSTGHGPLRRVAVVGGGLFPRTALVLRALLPDAEIVIIDASRDSLDEAAAYFAKLGAPRREAAATELRLARFCPIEHQGFDLIVFPLAFVGRRDVIEAARAVNGAVATHDWLWRKRGTSRVISTLLLKRLNLVTTTR